jgi:outer membrane protein OmpA-like peptidoglycan-associated protein
MYNIGIDRDAQQLNELVLNYTAQTLKDNPNYRVRLEGHANPYTINVSEIEDLMVLSAMRADVVAEQLRSRGVDEEQIVMIHFGGGRTVTNEWDFRNRNRRVELIILQVDID